MVDDRERDRGGYVLGIGVDDRLGWGFGEFGEGGWVWWMRKIWD